MAPASSTTVLRHLRALVPPTAGLDATDAQLLEAFVARREQAAFAALLRRHGPLVWSVSRRQLGQAADAEDVFQATFLLLAQNAGRIRKTASVASWLHGVAYRLAMGLRRRQARRQLRERKAGSMRTTPPPAEDRRELQELLDQALAQLPARQREALVLCYFEGMTQEEAARAMGCPLGTVRSWLARGRALLHKRLSRAGLTLSAAGFTALLAAGTASARVPAALLHTTLDGAARLVGSGAATGLSASVAALVKGGQAALAGTRMKCLCALVLTLGTLAAGAVGYPLLAQGGRGKEATPPTPHRADEQPRSIPAARNEGRADAEGDPLPADAVARLGTRHFRHDAWVLDAALSPDGRTLATAAGNCVWLWDATNGRPAGRVLEHDNMVSIVAWSPDGKLLASGGWYGNSIRLWDPATRREVRLLKGHGGEARRLEGGVLDLNFSPDGKSLVSSGGDKTIRLWDVATGRQRRRFDISARGQALFSPDGKTLAVRLFESGKRGEVRLWDAATGKGVRRLRHEGEVAGMAFSPDGKTLATAGRLQGPAGKRLDRPGVVWLWDVATGKTVGSLRGHREEAVSVSFAPDGKSLVSGGYDQAIILWSLTTGREVRRMTSRGTAVNRVIYSPNGKTVLSWGGRNMVQVWDLATGRAVYPTSDHVQGVHALAFSRDGKHLASCALMDPVRLWDLTTGKKNILLGGHSGPVKVAAFAPDGKTFLTASNDKTFRLWDRTTGRQLRRTELGDQIGCFALAPDGKTLALWASEVKRLRLVDVASGKPLRDLEEPPNGMDSLAFSPDGKYLAAGGGTDLTIHLWDTATGAKVRQYGPHKGGVHSVVFSPDGRTLVGACMAPCVHLWEVATGQERQVILNGYGITTVAFSPDSRFLAASSRGSSFLVVGDGTRREVGEEPKDVVYLWDLAAGRELRRFAGHRGGIAALAFSPDGRRLASGGNDTTILLWDVARHCGKRPAHEQSPAELKARWDDLGAGSAARAFTAVRELATSPRGAVALVKERLRPIPRPAATDPGRLARLVRDLDSDEFRVRNQAMTALASLGWGAEPALRGVLKDRPSLEVRRRCERLLKKLDAAGADGIREQRALEVLEWVGTPEAAAVLQGIAGGQPRARRTRQAREALKRLARRDPVGR